MPTPPSARSRVLVVGDINPDLILRGDVVPRFGQVEQLLEDARLVIGGSGAITAHGLARLDRLVSIVGAVGRDVFGEQICTELAQAGVDVAPVRRREAQPTGLTVVLSRAGDRAILTQPGAIASLTAAEVLGAATALGPGLAHIHISSLFLQPELGEALLPVLIELRSRGLTVSLDTNDDPALGWDIDALLPALDVLLPNRREVVALAHRSAPESEPRRAAQALAERGPLVVVKQGADGAFAARAGAPIVAVAARPVGSIDTTGAGDTFNAAFLDGWLDRLDLLACLERAAWAGSCTVGAIGGTAGQPNRHDLIREKGLNDQ
jgi:ribokinase